MNSSPLGGGTLGQLLALGEQRGGQGPRACFSLHSPAFQASRQEAHGHKLAPHSEERTLGPSAQHVVQPAATRFPSGIMMVMLGSDSQELGGSCASGCLFSSSLSFAASCGHPLGRGAFLSGGLMGWGAAPSVSRSAPLAAWGAGGGAWGASCCSRTFAPE